MSVLKELLLDVGLGKPIIRAALAAGVVTSWMMLTRPDMFWDKRTGRARPAELITWVKTEDSTFFPWYAVPVAAGVIAGGVF